MNLARLLADEAVDGLTEWDALETLLTGEKPLFPVEPPDGRFKSELPRQTRLRTLARQCAPGLWLFARPNAGKRNPRLAMLEGICGGGFDMECVWNHGRADIELKGYQRDGSKWRPNTLSRNQIYWGNRMTQLGHPVACFFDERKALAWLAGLGAPVCLRTLEGLRP